MPAIEYYDDAGVRHLICPSCGHDWVPIVDDPRMCPRCKKYLDDKTGIKCEWLVDAEKDKLCEECGNELAVVSHDGKRLGVRCLRKRGRL